MNQISLVFGIHVHQPVGQSDQRVDRLIDERVLPFLNTAAEHPKFKFCAHFSGVILRHIESRRPQVIDVLKKMIGQGQVEILGGGIYEPILPLLTTADQVGQIRRFSDYLHKLLGIRPNGVWLAERVGEPHLCKPIQEAGIKYVLLDDPHFAAAGVPVEEVHGHFLTEEFGQRVSVFPIDEGLRNLIPHKTSDEALDYLENLADEHPETLVTFIGNAESRMIEAFERAPFLKLTTPSEWMAGRAPRQLLYIPSASSVEISECSLPARLQEEYVGFRSKVERHTQAVGRRLFLRGGFWRAFLTKYPESNWTQKRVFAASTKMGPVLEKLGADREARTIRDLLDQASCNDAYWPGPSGGIVLPHLRRAIFQKLLEAENRFSKKMGLFPACFTNDMDSDGQQELIVYTAFWVLGFKPSLGGSMIEWSYRPACYNFQNTLTRRQESDPIFDRFQKCSGLLYALDPSISFDDFKKQALPEIVPADGAYDSKIDDKPENFGIHLKRETSRLSFEKHIVISKHESKLSLQASLTPKSAGGKTPEVAMGIGLELFYGSMEDMSIKLGEPTAGARPGLEEMLQGKEIEILDRWSGTRLGIKADRDVRFFIVPSHTASKFVGGPDKIFQGLSILILPVGMKQNERQEVTLKMEATSNAGT